jgi:tetratricopeptide (TPR) repeat protein
LDLDSLAQSNDPQSTAAVIYSKNSEANKLYLQAQQYLDNSDPRTGGTLANARRAITIYQQAVTKDPTFALAYVQMSRAWLRLGYSDPDGLSNDELLPPAKAALLKALALDKDLKEAHMVLAALYYNIDFDWQRAEQEYRTVLGVDAKNPIAHTSYAAFLASMGRFEEALSEARKAEELQSSLTTELTLARIYYSMRRHDLAAEYCKKSITRQDNVLGHFYLGFIHVAQNQYTDAISEFKTAAGFTKNGGALAGLAYGYAMAGRQTDAREILKRLNTNHKDGLIVPYRVAAVYVALHDNDQAIEWLNQEYKQKGNWMNQLKVDPVMDPLRSDPRFQDLMRRMKFE